MVENHVVVVGQRQKSMNMMANSKKKYDKPPTVLSKALQNENNNYTEKERLIAHSGIWLNSCMSNWDIRGDEESEEHID